MTDFTRKEIRRTFLGLLEKKPIEDITVRDIANGCGINRNTFYYHYTDIPSLLEEIVREDADMIIMMNDGRIEDVGTHDELLKRNENYQGLYNTQTKAKEA